MSSGDRDEHKAEKNDNESAADSVDNFRSPASDIEVPKTRQRRQSEKESNALDSPGLVDPLAMTKENMSTNRRPTDSAFTQQRLFGWQPILTPYNVLPVLFILGLIFVPLGAVFLTASMGVQEYMVDYTGCADASDSFAPIAAGSAIKMRKVSDGVCELEIPVDKAMKGPVAVYYRLTNFFQNNRLYAMSLSQAQLKGEAILAADQLTGCELLAADPESGKIYYPCGLIANSFFSDEFSPLTATIDGKEVVVPISSEGIAWPGDANLYGKSAYTVDQVVPPPNWKDRADLNVADGKYTEIPDLSKNERFMNWMKISGLPTFRKLYGRLVTEELAPGTYKLTIQDKYQVAQFQGTKSFVISTTNWAGGKNDALGIGFIAVGGLLLALGLLFLIMFMMAPRKVGDVSYLSWYSENSGDPLAQNDDEFIQEESTLQ